MRKILERSSELRQDFYDLIGTEVTFASDIIYINGSIIHKKGEKATVSDVSYNPGHWSKICPDIYDKAKISTLYINGEEDSCWVPDTFIEYI